MVLSPVLADYLVNLLGDNNHNVAKLQALLGKSPREGLDEDEDDED